MGSQQSCEQEALRQERLQKLIDAYAKIDWKNIDWKALEDIDSGPTIMKCKPEGYTETSMEVFEHKERRFGCTSDSVRTPYFWTYTHRRNRPFEERHVMKVMNALQGTCRRIEIRVDQDIWYWYAEGKKRSQEMGRD